MTKEEILTKAIEKAINGGFNGKPYITTWTLGEDYSLYEVIFSHDFAKTFWGEEEKLMHAGSLYLAWKYHLMQMVLEKDPIKYLEKFI